MTNGLRPRWWFSPEHCPGPGSETYIVCMTVLEIQTFEFKIYSKFILNIDFKCRWLMCLCFIGEEKQQNLISRRSSSSSAAVVAVVRCHIPAACGYNAPRHNDARLRPIKLTQNYIDDIFWARKFHGVRANGLDKISVALNNIWCGVVMTIAANM